MTEWNWNGQDTEVSLTDDEDGKYTLFVRNGQVDTWVTIPSKDVTALREFLNDTIENEGLPEP